MVVCSGVLVKTFVCLDVKGVGVGSLDESKPDGALKVLLEVHPSPKVRLAGSLSSGMGNWLVLTSGHSVV